MNQQKAAAEAQVLRRKISAAITSHPKSEEATFAAVLAMLAIVARIETCVRGVPFTEQLGSQLIEAMCEACDDAIADWIGRN